MCSGALRPPPWDVDDRPRMVSCPAIWGQPWWFQVVIYPLVQEIECSAGFDLASYLEFPMICVPSIISERDGFCVKKGFHRHV